MKKFLMISLALLLLSATMLSSCAQNDVKRTTESTNEQSEEETAYLQAKAYLEEAKYQEAYDLFLTIKNYKDVNEYLDRFFYGCGKETNPWGGITTYKYDAKGNLIQNYSPYQQERSEHEYTEDGYISKTKRFYHANGSAYPSDTILFEYNPLGCITKIDYVEQKVTIFVDYNSNNKPISAIVAWEGGDSYEVLWEYDTNGRVSKETYTERVNGNEDSGICVYTYESDKLGRVVRETRAYQGGSVATVYYEYNKQGNVIKETHTTGTASDETTEIIYEYQYDSTGNMTQKKEIQIREDRDDFVTVTTYSDYKLYYHWNPAFETNEWLEKRI